MLVEGSVRVRDQAAPSLGMVVLRPQSFVLPLHALQLMRAGVALRSSYPGGCRPLLPSSFAILRSTTWKRVLHGGAALTRSAERCFSSRVGDDHAILLSAMGRTGCAANNGVTEAVHSTLA